MSQQICILCELAEAEEVNLLVQWEQESTWQHEVADVTISTTLKLNAYLIIVVLV
jgi:hypothetical protein